MSIPNPIVLLDARARYVHPALTCERTSPKWLFGPDGQRHRVPENTMPWDYDPVTGEAIGLLVEDGATTLLSDTDIDDWTKNNVTVSDAGDGWRKVEATNAGEESRDVRVSFATTEGKFYTFSFDVKPGETPFGLVNISGSTFRADGSTAGFRVSFNAEAKEYTLHTAQANAGNFTFENLRNGGVRFWFTAEAFSDGSPDFRIFLKHEMSSSGDSTLALGDGLYVRAPMVTEVDDDADLDRQSFIEASGATAARSPDVVRISGVLNEPWFQENEGTFVVEASAFSDPIAGTVTYTPILTLYKGSLNGFGVTYGKNAEGIFIQEDSSSNTQRIGTVAVGSKIKAAFSYNLSSKTMRGAVGGSAPESLEMPSGEIDNSYSLRIGSGYIGGSSSGDSRYLRGHIYRVIYYPAGVSNADLQSLTAIQE